VREKPAVSVVIPTLNEQAAVTVAVQSVIAEAEVMGLHQPPPLGTRRGPQNDTL
jgi:hypothetical protein